jgi:GDPmannose 4,6-dehydratase
VKVDERYYRPAEIDLLVGDASKARRVLRWEPTYTFRDLIKEMVSSDLKAENVSRKGAKAQSSTHA